MLAMGIDHLVMDYLTLKDLMDWNFLDLPSSFLVRKVKEDYQHMLYDVHQVTEKNWKETFHYLYDFHASKAKVQRLDYKDKIWTGVDLSQGLSRRLYEKYPDLNRFTIGDVMVHPKWKLYYIIQEITSECFHGTACDDFSEEPHQVDVLPILTVPLQYWSELSFSYSWVFFLPEFASVVGEIPINVTEDIFLYIFIYRNVSYGILGYWNYQYLSVKVMYPFFRNPPQWFSTVPSNFRLTIDRVLTTITFFHEFQRNDSLRFLMPL